MLNFNFQIINLDITYETIIDLKKIIYPIISFQIQLHMSAPTSKCRATNSSTTSPYSFHPSFFCHLLTHS